MFDYKKAKNKLLFVVNRPDTIMAKGEGSYLMDTKGERYLDFVGGWATNTLGHSPQVILDALKNQAEKLVNASPAYYNEKMLQFAELITRVSGLDRVFFGSSGAEVNESAIKLARKFGALKKFGAYEIIALEYGFHGRTLATMSLTGKKKFQELFEPKVAGFHHVPINDFTALKNKVSQKTCAIFLELIQGEGGVNEVELEYLRQVKQLAKEENILLIFDEIQTGMARTGKLFAFEHYLLSEGEGEPIRPDIMTLGKGIGGGFPLAAMLTTEALNLFEPGDNGGTYTGQPLAMAVGEAVLEEVLRLELWEQVIEMGELIKQGLEDLAKKYPMTRIRGKGLLLAFTWNADNSHIYSAFELYQACLKSGMLINALDDRNIRLMPPLTVSKDDIEKFFEILKLVLSQSR